MNTLQIERLLKKDFKSKTIFKKVCALEQLEKPTLPSAYVINSDPSSKPGEVGLRFISTKAVEENTLIVMDYPLPCSVSTLTWMPTPYRDGFTIAKPYKRTFPVFVVIIVYFILFRCRGVPLHAIVSDFTSNLTENDRSISRFIRNVSTLIVQISFIKYVQKNENLFGLKGRV